MTEAGGRKPACLLSPMTKQKVRYLSNTQRRVLEKIQESTHEYIIGIDEVGVGCLAGPVVVAGVAAPKGWGSELERDSKGLTPKKRMKAFQEIIQPDPRLKLCLFSRTSEQVDAFGVWNCVHDLTKAAGLFLRQRFPDAPVVQDGEQPVAIDGSMKNVLFMAKADELVPVVSAASIVAKVSRDLFMMQQHKLHPHWEFYKNNGYRSVAHMAGIERHGLSPLHRRSYGPIKRYLAEQEVVNSSRGE